jgi:hypothetical protein
VSPSPQEFGKLPSRLKAGTWLFRIKNLASRSLRKGRADSLSSVEKVNSSATYMKNKEIEPDFHWRSEPLQVDRRGIENREKD